MATIEIAEVQISTDQASPTVSPSRNYGNGQRWIEVQLTSSEWDAKAGTGTITWGVEYRPTTTSPWYIAISKPDEIGARGRDGLLPRAMVSAEFFAQYAPMRLRLFAWCTVSLLAGAVVTTGTGPA